MSSTARSLHFPDVPTLAESLPPGIVLDNRSGPIAAGLPTPIVKRLFDAVSALRASGKLDATMEANAAGQFTQRVATENLAVREVDRGDRDARRGWVRL